MKSTVPIILELPFPRHIFQNGKTLPIDRKAGINQPIMKTAAGRAAEGDWIHIFPEARISYTGQLLPLKRGIGKLICDSIQDNPKWATLPIMSLRTSAALCILVSSFLPKSKSEYLFHAYDEHCYCCLNQPQVYDLQGLLLWGRASAPI